MNQLFEDMTLCVDLLRSLYPNAMLLMSGILPRKDRDDERGQRVNFDIQQYIQCQSVPLLKWVNFSEHFDKPWYFRYDFTQNDRYPDTVHLSDEGVIRFQELIRVQFERTFCETKFDHSSDLSEEAWKLMRQKRFKMKEPTRFKVTNYQPAAEAFQNYLAQGNPSEPPGPEELEEDIEETKLNQQELNEEVFDLQAKKYLPSFRISAIQVGRMNYEALAEESENSFCFCATGRTALAAKENVVQKIFKQKISTNT